MKPQFSPIVFSELSYMQIYSHKTSTVKPVIFTVICVGFLEAGQFKP